MPKIPEYTAPALDLRPSETGIDALSQAARRIGAFYSQAGEDMTQIGQRSAGALKDAMDVALKSAEHHDINVGSANFAALQDNLTQQWNDLAKKSDPNDPTVAQKFRTEVMEPELDKFQNNGFMTEAGQKFAQGHVAALRQHMFEKTSADMSTLAGEAAKVNTAQTINRLSNTVYNDSSSRDFALKTLESSVEGVVGSSPNITAAQSGAVRSEILEKGREQIVKAAAIGEIYRTAKVPDWVNDPQYSKYVNGIELRQFQRAAEQQAKANNYYDRQSQVIEKQQADLKVHRELNDVITNGVTVDPNDPNRLLIAPDAMRKTLDVVRNNPNAPGAADKARTVINWLQSEHDRKDELVRTDPEVLSSLVANISNPNKPTTEFDVLKAATDRKLNPRDTTLVREMVKSMGPDLLRDPVWHETSNAVKAELALSVPGIPGKDIVGETNYAKWMQTFVPQYLALKRADQLPTNALDLKDPASLISQSMAPFKRTVTDRMKDYVSVLGNLSDQNITGVKVENAPPFKPPKTWQYSASRDQFKDPATGKIYDRAGHEVK